MLAQLSMPRLDDLFEEDVFVRAAEITDCVDQLLSAERAAVSGAVPKRQWEFATGRVLARSMLAELGLEGSPLRAAADRTPCWPQGAVGSIAHADGLCVVALARSSDFLSIGVDLESAKPLNAEIWDMVCTASELKVLYAAPASDRGLFAKMSFVVKEAAYKCWYPLTRVPLDFHDVTVEIDLSRGQFVARVAPHVAAQTRPFSGRIGTRDRWILASTQLRRTASSEGVGAS